MVRIAVQAEEDPDLLAQAVESGDDVVLTVGGRDVGRVVPLIRWVPGEELMEIYKTPVDDGWESELRAQRAADGPPVDPWAR